MKKKILLITYILFTTFIFLSFSLRENVFAAEISCGNYFPDKSGRYTCETGCTPKYDTSAKEIQCVKIPIDPNGQITNPVLDPAVGSGNMGETIIAKLLAAIINLFFIAGSVAVLVYFLIGGLAWITSEGDKGKMEIAKNRLTFAGVGIVIIAATYAILQILGSFLGISFFKGLIIVWPTITGP